MSTTKAKTTRTKTKRERKAICVSVDLKHYQGAKKLMARRNHKVRQVIDACLVAYKRGELAV